MKKTKNNKTLFILVGVFAVFILGFMGLMIYGLTNTFSDEEVVKTSTNIGFEAIDIPDDISPNSTDVTEVFKQKRMAYEETNTGADNKDISFEVVSKNNEGKYTTQIDKPRTLLDPIVNTSANQNIRHNPQTTATPTTRKKDEKVLNDLAMLYKTDNSKNSSSPAQKTVQQQDQETNLERRKRVLQGGFSSTNQSSTNQPKSIIYAVVHGTQTIKMNGQILLRVTSTDGKTDDNFIIPKNTLVYGEVSAIKDGRLQISFSSALINGDLHPFSYNLFSLDGRSGIMVTSNKAAEEASDATKQAVTNQVRRSATNMLATAVDLITDISNSSSKENRLQLTLIDNQKFHLYSKK